jgi:archaellum component FlaC
VAGCGQPTTAEAEATLCNDLGQLEASLAELAQINANSQVNDLRQARENVANAYKNVQTAAQAVEEARLDDLQMAYDDLDKTVNNISGRETVGEATVQIADGMANVKAARQELSAGLQCPQ